ncbi:MAG TPA: cytochrome c3 family protein, partial [Thermoanaerobaculia bacterium]|nr:cytochrome c3 family protein [Thermoanaerobaculia bacterium]
MRLRGIVTATLLLTWAALAHAAKPVKPPGNDDCLTCHSDKDAKRSDGKSVFVAAPKFALSVHGKAGVACVDCHSDLAKAADFPHAARLKKVDCASCHDGAGASHPFHPEIARAAREKKEPQVACSDCHGTHDITATNDPAFRFARSRQAQACGDCHEDTSKHFLTSDHGKAFASGEKPAPGCVSCHRNPVTSGSGLSAVDLKRAQDRLCLSCHLYDESVKSRAAPTAGFIASFENSVHGRALKHGDARAPSCADCHGAHDERRGMDTSSFVNKMRVQQVCAKCHAAENLAFTASVHGSAIRKGNTDAPACTNCHGEHSILSPKDPRSPVAAANVSTQVCSTCHASQRITEKWNLPGDRTRTFSESYHGLAARGGVVEVANCASCHGSHDILPSSNPASRVNRTNMAATCGAAGCH